MFILDKGCCFVETEFTCVMAPKMTALNVPAHVGRVLAHVGAVPNGGS